MRAPLCRMLPSHACRNAPAVALLAALIFSLAMTGGEARAVTPESPEVREVVYSGLAALENETDSRLGGKCLIGLTFLKAERPNHPRVDEAVEACRQAMASDQRIDVYSNGIAIAFLCELEPRRYASEIRWYLNLLENRQKVHGGWGYDGINKDRHVAQTGDTSQTQYATLGYWTAHQHGFRLKPDSVENLANWLLHTQDPTGGWGYQGVFSQTSQRVPQDDVTCSRSAAGLGSVLICVDLLGGMPNRATALEGATVRAASALPPALRPPDWVPPSPPPEKITAKQIQAADLLTVVRSADAWMDQHYQIQMGGYTYYCLYATERFQSFRELLAGEFEDEPKWYNDGFNYLKKRQSKDGSWRASCGRAVDTSFALLFLMRSTQKIVRSTLGEGMLIGGRGLPANVATARMRGGRVVVEQAKTHLDDLLGMLDDPDQSQLEELARGSHYLVVDEVGEDSARRLRQLVRGGQPEVRLLAVRALARSGNLDYVPSLLYALTDPDPRVVLEARDGLKYLSRRFDGFGPPDDFTEQQRYEALSAWKDWYQSLRPGASVEP